MFFRKKQTAPPVAKRAKQLPYTKKVQFVHIGFDELTAMLENDLSGVLAIEPVNYYAEKRRFYQCVFYHSEDLDEIFMQFELYENDRRTRVTDYYNIDRGLYGKILLKFGQRL